MKHKIKHFALLFTFSLLLFNCQTNDETIQDNTSYIKTVPINDALNYLNDQTLTNGNKLAKSNKTDTYLTSISNEIKHEPLTNTNELLTVVPVSTINEKHYSRILLLEIDGSIESVVFSMTPDESPDSEAYDGEILVTDLDGNFLTGYIFSKGYMETEYVLPNTSAIAQKTMTSKGKECDCPFSVCDYCSLGTVFIGGGSDPDIPMTNYLVIPPIFRGGGSSSGVNGWNVGSAGVGFNGAFGEFMNGLSIQDQNFLMANFDIRNAIQRFLDKENHSGKAKEFAKSITIISRNPSLSEAQKLEQFNSAYDSFDPLLSQDDQISEYESKIRESIQNFRWYGDTRGEEFADYLESLLPLDNSFSKEDYYSLYKTIRAETKRLYYEYLLSIGEVVLESFKPVIELALWEVGGGLALKMLSKLPVRYLTTPIRNVITRLRAPSSTAFSQLKHAKKYGIQSYKNLKTTFDDLGLSLSREGVQRHHLFEYSNNDLSTIQTLLVN